MVNPEHKELVLLGQVTFWTIIVLVLLSYVAVGLRLWVRYRITKSPGWDDAAMIATLLLFTCYCAFIMTIIYRSMDRKLFSEEDIHVTLIFIQLSEVFYILTTSFLKLSLGLFFLRVLSKRWQKHLFHVILSISATFGLFYVLIVIFRCGDPTRLADSLQSPSSPKCLPPTLILASGYIYGIINVIADWTFVLIPITVLLDSDLDRRSKISVSFVMALGAVGSVSSIFRMVYLKGLGFQAGPGLHTEAVKATIWATAEPGTGIIAASIAILRPLFRKIALDVRSKASSYSYSRKGSAQSDDSIGLTGQDMVAQEMQKKKQLSVYRVSEDLDPWSPTMVETADVQRMIVVKGRMSPVPAARAKEDGMI